MINPADLLGMDRDTSLARRDGREVYLHYSTRVRCTTCGFDERSYASKKVDCETCGGRGEVLTWYSAQSQARVNWQRRPETTIIRGGEVWMGDFVLLASRDERAVYQKVIDDQSGYLIIDGHTARPSIIHETGNGAEIVVPCDMVNLESLRYG